MPPRSRMGQLVSHIVECNKAKIIPNKRLYTVNTRNKIPRIKSTEQTDRQDHVPWICLPQGDLITVNYRSATYRSSAPQRGPLGQGCGLGLDVSVSRRSRDPLRPRLRSCLDERLVLGIEGLVLVAVSDS